MKATKFIIASLILTFGLFTGVKAQNYSDVLRYSQKYYQGTARSFGLGNALGAIGGDFTAIDINPAGLGIYKRNEFSGSLNINQQSANSTYLGLETQDDKYNVNVSQLGLVFVNEQTKMGKPVKDGWSSLNVGMGFTRTNNFHNNIAVEGMNNKTSILTMFKEDAQGKAAADMDPFSLGYLAYYTGLIQTLSDQDTTHFSELYNYEKGKFSQTYQTDYISSYGAMNDIHLTFAANYSNRLYIGGSLQLPTVGYHYKRIFKETNTSDSIVYYNSAKYIENLHTSGVGFSANFGVIYKLAEPVRLGVALQLPTFYSLTDSYDYQVSSVINTLGNYSEKSPIGTFKYSLVTPMKVTFSGAFLIGKHGFISIDDEWVNYGNGRINTNYEGATNENRKIKDVLRGANNLRIGGELRNQGFYLRGGYANYASPYDSKAVPNNADGSSQIISAGVGYRDSDYFIDLGFQNQKINSYYLPYHLAAGNDNGAVINNVRNSFIVSVGTKF